MTRAAGGVAAALVLIGMLGVLTAGPAQAAAKPRPTTTTKATAVPRTSPKSTTTSAATPPAGSGAANVTAHIVLVHQTAWITPGDDADFQVRIEAMTDPTDLEVAVDVYRPVDNRQDLRATFNGDKLSGGREALVQRLDTAPPNPDGTFTLTLPTRGPTPAAGPPDPGASGAQRFLLPSMGRAGVAIYPVQVELRHKDDGPAVDRFVTEVLAVPPHADGSRLRVTLVLPVHAPPQSQTKSSEVPTPPVGTTGIDQLVSDLDRFPSQAVVLAPVPETLDELDDAARTTLAGLAHASSSRQVVVQPWVPVDVDALGESARGELANQLQAGAQATGSLLGIDPSSLDRRTWVAEDPLDATSLQAAVAAGASRLVVQESDLTRAANGRAQPLQPTTLTAKGVPPMPTLTSDPAFATELDPSLPVDRQALAADHALADLAFLDATNAEQGPRVVTILAPRNWKALPGFLPELMGGLATSPVLRAADLDDDFAGVPAATVGRAGTPVTRTLADPGRAPARSPLAFKVAVARQRLAIRNAVLSADKDRAADLDRSLLTAESRDLTADEQSARIAAVSTAADADLHGIRMPGNRTVSLTARTGEIPVTVLNDTGKVAQVLVRLESDKLAFPEGDSKVLLLDKQATTQLFKVRAPTAGAVPLRVYLETPDGREPLTKLPTRFTVRQTAVPGLGIALLVLAAGVLLFWWVRSLLRGHYANRRRRAVRTWPARDDDRN